MPRSTPTRAGLLIGSAALVLYASTCLPGVAWQDSGNHQYRILVGAAENPYGLALSHPLHHWLGRGLLAVIPPSIDPAYALNLMSSLFGAVGVGCLAALLFALTGRFFAALLGAGVTMLGHAYWQMSCMTETYTLAAALMTVEWLLLLRFARTRRPAWLIAVTGVNGLYVANHLLGLLTLATYGILWLWLLLRARGDGPSAFVHNSVRRHAADASDAGASTTAAAPMPVSSSSAASPHSMRPGSAACIAALLWIAAASPYWTLVISHYQRTGDAAETLYSTFFGQEFASSVLNLNVTSGALRTAPLIFAYNFPSLVPLVALLVMIVTAVRKGCLDDRRERGQSGGPADSATSEGSSSGGGDGARPPPFDRGGSSATSSADGQTTTISSRVPERLFPLLLLAQSALILLFVLRYSIYDQYTFYVPVCAVVGFWFGVGVDRCLSGAQTAGGRRLAAAFLAVNVLSPLLVYPLAPEYARSHKWFATRLRDIAFRDKYAHFLHPWKRHDHSAELFALEALRRARPGDWLLFDMTTAYNTAFIYRTRGGPKNIRIYAFEKSVDNLARGDLTGDELQWHIQSGWRAWAAPIAAIDRQWSPFVRFDKSDRDFWFADTTTPAPPPAFQTAKEAKTP